MMDLHEIRADLEEHFPLWSDRIRLLRFQSSTRVGRAAKDGSSIFYNDEAMRHMTREDRCFYMAQQLMHIQLAHSARRGDRDRLVWDRACDAVVNSLLREEGFQLPPDAPVLRGAAGGSAESLYEALYALEEGDLMAAPDPELVETQRPRRAGQGGEQGTAQAIQLEDPGIAAAVAGLAELLEPSYQLDFDWFPGTTIRDGMLRYEFRAYPVAQAEILLDTSASVDEALLRRFVRGVKALLRQDAIVRVGCFDTRFYGFQDVASEEDIENLDLQGTGGTDFTVAIHAFTGDAENRIIFTDGYAEMPEESCHAVWVVYGNAVIHPKGGRVIYVKPSEEKEKHEVDFLIT